MINSGLNEVPNYKIHTRIRGALRNRGYLQILDSFLGLGGGESVVKVVLAGKDPSITCHLSLRALKGDLFNMPTHLTSHKASWRCLTLWAHDCKGISSWTDPTFNALLLRVWQSPAGVWTSSSFCQVFLHFRNIVDVREESPSVIFTLRPFNYLILFIRSMGVSAPQILHFHMWVLVRETRHLRAGGLVKDVHFNLHCCDGNERQLGHSSLQSPDYAARQK